MPNFESFVNGIDSFFAWISSSLKQATETYCELETADSKHTLVTHDGSMISIVKIPGATALMGTQEFDLLIKGLSQSLSGPMQKQGHSLQVFFNYTKETIKEDINRIYSPALATSNRLNLNLNDLFSERVDFLSRYCASEEVFFVFWTKPSALTKEQLKEAGQQKIKLIKDLKIKPFYFSQNLMATIPYIRDEHNSFVKSVCEDLRGLNVISEILDIHEAVRMARKSVDPNVTNDAWKALLPGDSFRPKEVNMFNCESSDLLWPSLAKQVIPRDAENIDLRTVRIGDKIYSSVFIDLFPKDIQSFITLFNRCLNTHIPWRLSYFLESDGLPTLRFKKLMSGILSFTSSQNRLFNEASSLLDYISVNKDESLIKLRVAAATWAPEDNVKLLRNRTSELTKAIQGWGSCQVSDICGDALSGALSSALAVNSDNVANATVAPLSDSIYMLPITRPASQWKNGALIYRTPDGKLWPFQPGSPMQTTWIDLVYARPGSGKSVLSNAMNLALCMAGGIERLPRIAILDIGPSSSGLISLLREALPAKDKHLVAYHRLRMVPEFSINPFDTQLGSRYPTPQERSFLVNFLTLLSTPVGSEKSYDGIGDLAGMVVDELYKSLADDGKPYPYDEGVNPIIDNLLDQINFKKDNNSTWFEVTDAFFKAGFIHEAMLAQRYAMPLLADAASICRQPSIEDLYGKITVPTGETLINSFSRMISSSVREYPILSRVTAFDLGESRIISLDLDEVAKSGGDSADRQTAVMYMLGRYVLAKDYYLHTDNVNDMPDLYKEFHKKRIAEIQEDSKRIVYDEFHRTSKSKAVRDQVVIDMREGRKWNVQIALLSQSLVDFDPVMVEFATSVYILDSGPASAQAETAKTFGLSETAKIALATRVHGPRAGGATFLAQFSTKSGTNIQLLTLTLGPIELWSFSTTSEDAIIRNSLYKKIGPKEARRLLSTLFPNGTATNLLQERMSSLVQDDGIIKEDDHKGLVNQLITDILEGYTKNPNIQRLPK